MGVFLFLGGNMTKKKLEALRKELLELRMEQELNRKEPGDKSYNEECIKETRSKIASEIAKDIERKNRRKR